MSKDPIISLGKFAKKLEVRDYYLARLVNAPLIDAYNAWGETDTFLRWFVPLELTVASYEHNLTQIKIALRDHIGDTKEYRLLYNIQEHETLIQLTGGRYFEGQRAGENQAVFTIKFDERCLHSEELGEDIKVTFVQLLIRHPKVEDWLTAKDDDLHKLWTGAFDRYVAHAEAR